MTTTTPKTTIPKTTTTKPRAAKATPVKTGATKAPRRSPAAQPPGKAPTGPGGHSESSADAVSVFRMVPVIDITEHPSNIRRDMGDLTELADSIRGSGVLQPLLLAPAITAGPARHVVIAGHRRLRAAIAAGLLEVPATVRSDLNTLASQIAAMCTENLQRTDLTPLEEADAYQALLDLDITTDAIASTTGRSVTTVRSRVKLLTLPADALDRVHAGQLTLSEAEDLTALADDPTEVAEVLAAAGDFKWALQRVKNRRAKRATDEANLVVWAAAGVDIVDRESLPKEWRQWADETPPAHVYEDGPVVEHDPDTSPDDACPCRVVVVDRSNNYLQVYTGLCSTPDIHNDAGGGTGRDLSPSEAPAGARDADPGAPGSVPSSGFGSGASEGGPGEGVRAAAAAGQAQSQSYAQARVEAWAEDFATAKGLRMAWILEMVRGGGVVTAVGVSELMRFAADRAVQWDDWVDGADWIAEQLGVDATSATRTGQLEERILDAAHDTLTPSGWLLLVQVAQFECLPPWRAQTSLDPDWGPYLRFLGRCGYELTAWETTQLNVLAAAETVTAGLDDVKTDVDVVDELDELGPDHDADEDDGDGVDGEVDG